MKYDFKWMSRKDLLEIIKDIVLERTGLSFNFKLELSKDNTMNLYLKDNYKFTEKELDIFVKLGWVQDDIFIKQKLSNDNISPFDFIKENLSEQCTLFQFMLQQAFGEGTYIAKIDKDEHNTDIILNIAIPFVLKNNNEENNEELLAIKMFGNTANGEGNVSLCLSSKFRNLPLEARWYFTKHLLEGISFTEIVHKFFSKKELEIILQKNMKL